MRMNISMEAVRACRSEQSLNESMMIEVDGEDFSSLVAFLARLYSLL